MEYNDRLKVHDLSMFQLYCCVTKSLTFRATDSYMSTLGYTESALGLLTKKKDRLLEDGEIRRKKYADNLAKAAVKRATAKRELTLSK